MPRGDYDYHHASTANQFLAILIVILIVAVSLGALTLFGIILN